MQQDLPLCWMTLFEDGTHIVMTDDVRSFFTKLLMQIIVSMIALPIMTAFHIVHPVSAQEQAQQISPPETVSQPPSAPPRAPKSRRSRKATPLAQAPASLNESQQRAACIAETAGKERQTGTIMRIDATGDIVLNDGRTLIAQHIHRPSDAPLANWPAPQSLISYISLGSGPDRWGRLHARITVTKAEPGTEGGSTLWLEEEWLQRGLAIVRPEPGDSECLTRLLQSERTARQSRQGLWANAATIGQADQPETLIARSGNYIIIEGVILSVGERSSRTYLNFGTSWNEDTTVSIAKPLWTAMASRGLSKATLENRRIRARGFLQMRGGPLITLTNIDEIELTGDN
jgi:hypothetical protein